MSQIQHVDSEQQVYQRLCPGQLVMISTCSTCWLMSEEIQAPVTLDRLKSVSEMLQRHLSGLHKHHQEKRRRTEGEVSYR